MSSEKRRRARVQGGWAAPSNSSPRPRSDAHKPPMPSAPGWLANNADPAPASKFTYNEPKEDIKKPPKEKFIDKTGVYDISETVNGVSRVRLFPNFIELKDAHWFYEHLFQEIPWQQMSDSRDGVTYQQPRLVSWFGDFPYSYSGVSHPANTQKVQQKHSLKWPVTLNLLKCQVEELTGLQLCGVEVALYRNKEDFLPWNNTDKNMTEKIVLVSFGSSKCMFEMKRRLLNWTPTLRKVKDKLEENLGLKFNSMLANLYRDGHDMVAWHSDDEPALRKLPTIASLSFGDTRMFELRKKPLPGSDPTDYTYMEHIKMPLTEGSLLIMEGAMQEDWQHRIPKEYHDRSPRINLTFRVIYPD